MKSTTLPGRRQSPGASDTENIGEWHKKGVRHMRRHPRRSKNFSHSVQDPQLIFIENIFSKD
jgi:hypothetical protein